jgi:hypothetical protein
MLNRLGVVSIPMHPAGPAFLQLPARWHREGVTDMYEVGELEDLAVLPSQFADLRRSAKYDGMRMLILAVLEDAIRVWARNKQPPLALKRSTIEVGGWLFDEDDREPFSLNWICDNLGIDADCLRAQLRRNSSDIMIHRRGAARANRIGLGRAKL